MATVTIRVTEEERATIIAALLNYSCYWGAKADRGVEGRAQCSLIANEAEQLYKKLSGIGLVPLAVVAPSVAPAKANDATKGGNVLAPKSPPTQPSPQARVIPLIQGKSLPAINPIDIDF